MQTDIRSFGTARDGMRVEAVRLGTGALRVVILTRGAVLQDLRLAGVAYSLTLGSPDLAAYEGPMAYFGALVGPVANRIAGARAAVAGAERRFPANEGTTLLHGGAHGLHTRHWTIAEVGPAHLHLTLRLKDGDGGFPGRRELAAVFAVGDTTLALTLTATSNAPTLMNLANHSYWNLDGTADTHGHRLQIAAGHYLPVNDQTLPTGEVRAAEGAFDLRGGRILDGSEGYDHNFCLAPAPRALAEVASLTGQSGLRLTLATTEPGLQLYDGRRLATAPFAGNGGIPYGPHAGIALEAQRWPDATNHPAFPSIALAPGETYRQETRWEFGRG